MLLPKLLTFLVCITRTSLVLITIIILVSCGGSGSNTPSGGSSSGGFPSGQKPCNGEILIQSEAEIADYAHCTNINGTVAFAGNNFNDIEGFNNLVSVSGDIEIYGKEGLDSISGFNSLESIGGSLWISGNAQLTSIDAFNNLESIGESLILSENPQLQTISVFTSLGLIEDVFRFYNLPRIGSIDQFPALEVVNGTVLIGRNGFDDQTGRIFALHQLGYCPSSLEVSDETGLGEAQYCTRVRGDLFFTGSTLSESLGTFPRLKQVDGSLRVRGTGVLTSLGEFPVLESIGDNIYLQNNIMLANGGDFSKLTQLGGSISITFNPELIHLPQFSSLTTLNSNLTVENNSKLMDMSGLEQLDSIDGFLSIEDNFALQTLTGLNALQIVQDEVTINALNSLENLNGLEGLGVVGSLTISGNLALLNLSGLNALENFGTGLSISGNPLLQSLNAFTQLDSVASMIAISANDQLESVAGFENIEVLERLHISSNDMLPSLAGLNNLVVVTGALTILGNDLLEDYAGLSNLTTVGESMNLDSSSVLAPEVIAEFRQSLGVDCNMDDCRIYSMNHGSGSSLLLRGRARAFVDEPFALFLNEVGSWNLRSKDGSCDETYGAVFTELFLVNVACPGEYLLRVTANGETIEQNIVVRSVPPELAFEGVPETLSEGDTMNVQVSVLNPEKGPFVLHSVSGPSGVNLDESGASINWSKANEIFSINPDLTLNFGLYAGGNPEAQFTFTTELNLNASPTIDYFPFEESILSGGTVGGIDLQPGSSEGDIVYFSGSNLYKYRKATGEVTRTPGGLAGGYIHADSINYFDITGDGIPEVGYIYRQPTGISNNYQAKLYVYNLVTETALVNEVLIEHYISSISPAEAISVSPYRMNGQLNYAIAFAGSFRGEGAEGVIQTSGLYNYNATTKTYASLVDLSQGPTQPGFNISGFKIEDMDNDSNMEFYVVGYDYSSTKRLYKYEFTEGGFVLSDTLSFIVSGSTDTLAGFYFTDTNNDGLKEIVWLGSSVFCNEADEGTVVRVIDHELNIIKQKYEKFGFGNYTALPKVSSDSMNVYVNVRFCDSGQVRLVYYDVKNQALVWSAQYVDITDPVHRVVVANNSATEFTNADGNRALFVGGRNGVRIVTPQ